MPPHPFYGQQAWRKLAAKRKAQWRKQGLPCGYCGEPLDWNARPIADHIKPRHTHPHLALAPENVQIVHHACNTLKARGTPPPTQTRADGFPEGWG